jgi:prephenate dehydrogenase
MEERFALAEATVGIVGLGLMGGSLALALKGHCGTVVGADTDPATLEEACRQGAVSRADLDPAGILPGVDLVILATPVPAIIDLLDKIATLVTNPCIVMDVGSAKRSVISAMQSLPERFETIGGHPLCGKERLSFANADKDLYNDAPFFLTPLPRTTARAMSGAQQLTKAIGAKPVIVSPEEHDRFMAQTSHLPFLLSTALTLAVEQECAPFVGPGFRSTSRLASTSASMMLGVLQSNRDNVLDALHRIQGELAGIERLLDSEDHSSLEALLDAAKSKHRTLVQS